ncbi:MAG TPA: hypothetical protein VK627_00135 [Edaphobacter sp.]|jgi:hypothetical protein|nr:hypothetical protein [Edaphobacter sp.]
MDFPLPVRKSSWRDSLYAKVTVETAVSLALVLALALPPCLSLAIKLNLWRELAANPCDLFHFLLLRTWWVAPYLWLYFFALARVRTKP